MMNERNEVFCHSVDKLVLKSMKKKDRQAGCWSNHPPGFDQGPSKDTKTFKNSFFKKWKQALFKHESKNLKVPHLILRNEKKTPSLEPNCHTAF